MKNFIKNEIDYWKSVILARKNARLMKYMAEYHKYNSEIERLKENSLTEQLLKAMVQANVLDPNAEAWKINKEDGSNKLKGQKDGKVGSGDSGHNS